MKQELIDFLSEFVTPDRWNLFDRIIEERTKYLTIVLEDIFQPQNASAVLRTADCFGVQDVHIIENRNEFCVDREVSLGASKWVSLKKYNQKEKNTRDALMHLKSEGYRIVATTPHENDVNLEDFDLLQGKSAIVFGTELKGISEIVKEEADEFMKIPMYGFTESFNISVSAAIIMHHLTYQLKNHTDIDWKLKEEDRQDVFLQWLKKTIKSSDLILKEFYERNKS